MAEQVIAEIDRDRNGAISKYEAAAYAELLARSLRSVLYFINAARPKFDAVEITRHKRNENQSVGEIAFTFQPFHPKTAEAGTRP